MIPEWEDFLGFKSIATPKDDVYTHGLPIKSFLSKKLIFRTTTITWCPDLYVCEGESNFLEKPSKLRLEVSN